MARADFAVAAVRFARLRRRIRTAPRAAERRAVAGFECGVRPYVGVANPGEPGV